MSKFLNAFVNLFNGKQNTPIPDSIHNVVNYDNGSLLLDVEQLMHSVDMLEKGCRLQTFTQLEDIGVDSTTANFNDLLIAFPNESMVVIEVTSTTFTHMDISPTIAGVKQEGTTVILGGPNGANWLELTFYNELGKWRRRINAYVPAGNLTLNDSGWQMITTNGIQIEITSAMVTNLSNKLENLKTPGEYQISGTNLNLLTDNPFNTYNATTVASRISVYKSRQGGNIIQEVNSMLSGGRYKFTRALEYSGTISTWTMWLNSQSQTRNLVPETSATYNLGAAGTTFNNAYLQNAPIVVCDSDHKDFMMDIPDEILDAWHTVNYSQWKMKSAIIEKGPDKSRFHVGIIAQEIRDKFIAAGLDATAYGILIYSEWEGQEEVLHKPEQYDDEGRIVSQEVKYQPARQAGHVWMVRMEECLALEAALMRRHLESINDRLMKAGI